MVALVPTVEDIEAAAQGEDGAQQGGNMVPMNRALMVGEPTSNRVPESDEMRKDMPKASALDDDDTSLFDPLRRVASLPGDQDDRIEMLIRSVAKTAEDGQEPEFEEEEVPVIGSFHTRHMALARRPEAWYLDERWKPRSEDVA